MDGSSVSDNRPLTVAIACANPRNHAWLYSLLPTLAPGFVVTELDDTEQMARHLPSTEILLVDVKLPGLGGMRGLKKLLSVNPNCTILLFGDGITEDQLQRSIQYGGRGHIPFGIHAAALAAALRFTHAGHLYDLPILQRRQANAPNRQPTITASDADVLRLLAKGYDKANIATTLFLTPIEAQRQVKRIMRKFHIINRVHAAAVAQKLGLI